MISIYRNITKVLDLEPQSSSNYVESVMADHQLTVVWEQATHTALAIGDYITYGGVQYKLNRLPTVKKISSKCYQYNAIFQHPKYDAAKVMYLLFDSTATPAQGEFSLTGTADTFITLLVANLNRQGSVVWTKGTVVTTDYRTLTFSNESCMQVLERLAAEFDTEYRVINRQVNLAKLSTARSLTLEYGSTAYDIERSSVNSSDIVTRLYVYGSQRNIAADYRDGSKRLLLPSPALYLDSAQQANYGVIEKSHTFDDIYPRLASGGAGVVTHVVDEFIFADTALDFDLNTYLMAGVPAKVHFLTGQCAGYDFEIASYTHATKTFKIIANTVDPDLVLPTVDLRPDVGDKYTLVDIAMPAAYVTAAEAELLARATAHLATIDKPAVEYKVSFSSLYAKVNAPVIEAGDTVNVYDVALGIDEAIRIIKITRGLQETYNIQIDLSNTVTATRIVRIESDIHDLTINTITESETRRQLALMGYQRTRELHDMIYDADGSFDPANIKPASITTGMLTTGARSQQFQLTTLLQPNYAGNPQVLHWSGGTLTHFNIDEATTPLWVLASGSMTITGANETRALYMYARCLRSGSTGDILVSEVAYKWDHGTTHWYFLIGILHTPVSGVRGISLTYGQTTINGGFIRTGTISSVDGATYFNLTNGEIAGNIKFRAGGTLYDLPAFLDGMISSSEAYADDVAGEAQGAAEAYAAGVAGAVQTNLDNMKVGGESITDASNETLAATTAFEHRLLYGNYSGTPTGPYLKNSTAYVFTVEQLEKLAGAATNAMLIGYDFVNDVAGAVYSAVQFQGTRQSIVFTVPATGYWSVLLYPGSPASTAGNTIRWTNLMIQEGNRATAFISAVKYLTTALKGSTDILGGLLATNLVLMKNEAEAITGGFSGLTADNVGIWTGGTYAEALAALAKIVLRKDGSGQLAGGNLTWDVLGNLVSKGQIEANSGLFGLLKIIGSVIESKYMKISDTAIDALATVNAQRSYTLLSTAGGTVQLTPAAPSHAYQSNEVYIEGASTLGTVYIRLYADNPQPFVGPEGSSVRFNMKLECFNNGVLVGTNLYQQTITPGSTINYATGPSLSGIALAKGTVQLKATIYLDNMNATFLAGSGGSVGNVSTRITANTFGYTQNLTLTAWANRTEIGGNGFYSFLEQNKYLYFGSAGLEVKGATNMPGVLASGTIASNGTRSNHWGAKISTGSITKGGTGIYDIPHAVGHANFTVFVTPHVTSCVAFAPTAERTSTNVRVAIKNTSNSFVDAGFDYVIMGTN